MKRILLTLLCSGIISIQAVKVKMPSAETLLLRLLDSDLKKACKYLAKKTNLAKKLEHATLETSEIESILDEVIKKIIDLDMKLEVKVNRYFILKILVRHSYEATEEIKSTLLIKK